MSFKQVFTTLNVNPRELAPGSSFHRKYSFRPLILGVYRSHCQTVREEKNLSRIFRKKKNNTGNLCIVIVLRTFLKTSHSDFENLCACGWLGFLWPFCSLSSAEHWSLSEGCHAIFGKALTARNKEKQAAEQWF